MRSGIEELREKIDWIDNQIKVLFEQRMALALEIAEIKQKNHLPIIDIKREREIISRLTAGQSDDLVESMTVLYSVILAESRSYQVKKSGSKQ